MTAFVYVLLLCPAVGCMILFMNKLIPQLTSDPSNEFFG